MLSLRQSLTIIGKQSTTRIPSDLSMSCKSLKDTLIAWNHLPYQLLIITPQEFVESVRPLADHKNSTGIATILISLEHIYQVYPGRDEAEKVKHCLALFKRNNDVRYAMLVGDGDMFPARFVKWWLRTETVEDEQKYKGAFHTLFVPSDLYYAALFKDDGSFDDWDGNKDGYFGEVPPFGPNAGNGPINPDDVHMIPNLAVGRIPASTPEEVRVYVRKVIAYEKEAFDKSWTKAALLVSGDYSSEYSAKLNDIASKYLQGYKIHKLYWWQNDWGAKPKYIKDIESPTPEKINAYMNPPEGVKFVAYMGHGDHNGWAIGPNVWYASHYLKTGDPLYDPSDRGNIDDLVNWDRLPVVFSTGCDTGQFITYPPLLRYRDVDGVDHRGVLDGEIFLSIPPKPACLQPKDPNSIAKDVESMAEGMTVEQRKDKSGKIRENGTGAIAYIGNTITGWEEGPELLEYFSEVLATKKILGDIWLHMLNVYYRSHKPPAPDKQANQQDLNEYFRILGPWHLGLFGDPSLRVGGIPS
jgi:hypothetical protein